MNLSVDELLFYGGMACAGAAALAELLCLGIYLVKKRRLNAQLEKEYGRRE